MGLVVMAACGGAAVSSVPSAAPTSIPAGSFADLAFSLELPAGWVFGKGEDLEAVVARLAEDRPDEAAKLQAILADSPPATSSFVAFDLGSADAFTPSLGCQTLDRGAAAAAAVLYQGEKQNVEAVAQLPNLIGQPASDRFSLPVGETVRVRWTWEDWEGDARRASIGYLFVSDVLVVTCVFSADAATIASHEPEWEAILRTYRDTPGASPGPSTPQAVVDMHEAPEVEELLPTTVAGRRLTTWSVRGESVLRLWGLASSQRATVKDEFTRLGASLEEVVQATAGRSDVNEDPPYFVFAHDIPSSARDLLGGFAIRSAGFTRDTQDWQLESRVVGGKDVSVGPLDLIHQSEHERGRPYLYVTTDDLMFVVVTDDESWAADALRQLPATAFSSPAPASSAGSTIVSAGLSMRPPPGWTPSFESDGVHLFGPDGEHVLLSASAKGDHTLASWSADDVAFWKSAWNGAINASADSTVGGVSSRRITVAFDYDGVPSFAIAEAFLHGDLAYTLYWWSPVGNEAADTATFQRVVDSCEFTP